MWTVEKLREASVARGERSTSPVVDRALLAFERWKGRTEETYSRDQAKKDLDAVLDKLDMASFPRERRGEFPGLRELRSYARERAKEREAMLGKVVKAVKQMVGQVKHTVPQKERMMEQDRDR